MKSSQFRTVFLFSTLLAISGISASDTLIAEEENKMSYVGKVLEGYSVPDDAQRSVESIASAWKAFHKSLTPEERAKAVRPPLDPEWRKWSNLPPRLDYAGICLKDVSPEHIKLFLNLMAESTSHYGFEKSRDIMLSDDKLIDPENPPTSWPLLGTDYFWVVLFGHPDKSETWGWQLDGHHLGLNLIISGDQLTIAPSFIGTQPAKFNYGKRTGLQPMKTEATLPYQIVAALDDNLKKRAVVGKRSQGMDAGPGNDKTIPQPKGLPISLMAQAQKAQILQLASTWINIMPEKWAKMELAKLKTNLNDGHFAWKGNTSPSDPVYYQIHIPGFFVEFSHQNLGGDPFNHLHSVYRSPNNDYLNKNIPH